MSKLITLGIVLLFCFPAVAQEESLTITIPGTRQGWLDTGIQFEPGDVFSVQSSGAINIWPNCEETKVQEGFPDLDCALVTFGPNGTTAFDPAPLDYPYPGGLLGALVGKIGDNQPFLIGEGGTFTAETSGLLELAINENFITEDNLGEFVAIVTVPEGIPLPSTNGVWQDTGLFIEAGQAFTINANGTVNIWPNCEETKVEQGYPDVDCALMNVTPDGTTVFPPALEGYPLPGANVGALVARIGDGAAFLVGSHGAFIAESSGNLFIAVNDTEFFSQDDEGNFEIVITLEPLGDVFYIPGTLDEWFETGIQLEAGQSITLSASGTVNIWPRCEQEKVRAGLPDMDCALMEFGPTGTTGLELAEDDYPMPGTRVGALVGRVGDGASFFIGNGGTFTATESGELQFRINDIVGMYDNSGGFIVVHSPEVPT